VAIVPYADTVPKPSVAVLDPAPVNDTPEASVSNVRLMELSMVAVTVRVPLEVA
jgi:hypothetical protein